MIKRLTATGASLALAVGLSFSAAAPAQANAIEQTSARLCSGDEVYRCITLSRNDPGKITAWAKITDITGRSNYYVAIQNVRLQRASVSRWVTVATVADYDGWHATSDSPAYEPGSRNCGTYRAVATFKWKKAGTNNISSQTIASKHSVWC